MEKKEAVDEALHVFKDLVKQLEKELQNKLKELFLLMYKQLLI